MTDRLLPPGNRAPIRLLAGLEALDPPAKLIAKKVRSIIKPPLKDALSGSWLGHPLHPVLTDVTIGRSRAPCCSTGSAGSAHVPPPSA